MGLKAVVTAEEYAQLGDPVKAFYVGDAQKGYALDTDITVHPAAQGLLNTVKATREERDGLKRQLQETVDQYKDIDPAKAREALDRLRKLDEKKLIDEGQIEELLKSRFGPREKDLLSQNEATAKDRDRWKEKCASAEERLAAELIDGGLRKAAADAGVKPSAIEDVLLRGRLVWRLSAEGKPEARRGNDLIYGKASQPITMEEWVASLATDAGHLFEGNVGARTEPSVRQPGGGRRITLTREEARDPHRWRAAQAAAEKDGAEVVIAET